MEMNKVSDLPNADKIEEDVLTSTEPTTDEMKEFFNQGMVKSVNGEAPINNQLYARSNRSWVEIEYKSESGVNSPKFIIDEPIVLPLTNFIAMSNTTYSIPLIAVSEELSDKLTLTHGYNEDYFPIVPHIAKKNDGSRYLVFNTSYSSGVLRFVITDNSNGKQHIIVGKLCSDYPVLIRSHSATYNKQNRILTYYIRYFWDSTVKQFPAKYQFSLTPIGNKKNCDNNEKIKFIPAWHHDVLGQFIVYTDEEHYLKAVLDKSPEPGLYLCSLYDLYKGNILETLLTIS